VPGQLFVGDNHDMGALRLRAFSVLDSNNQLDRSQSFIQLTSDSFTAGSHGDMLFAVRDALDGFRFQLLPPQTEEDIPNGGYKVYTVARIDSTGKGFFDGGTQTGGADFAESISPSGAKIDYEPGDVLVIDANVDRRFTLSSSPYSTLVAGIYSTKPGVVATGDRTEEPKMTREKPIANLGNGSFQGDAGKGASSRWGLLVTSFTPWCS